MKTHFSFRWRTLSALSLLLLPISLLSQNPTTRVFEDWNTTSGTQNNFQRSIVRSKSFGGATYYYTCGSTLNSSGNYDMFIEKKNGSGTILWTQTYNGAGNGNDYAADVQITSGGSVYVFGTYYKNSTDSNNAIIIKYNNSGTQQWTYTYNGAGSRHDMFAAIQVGGNAIVGVGTTYKGSTNLYDMLAVRIDSSGNNVWSQTWDYANLNDAAVNLWNNGTKLFIAGGAQSAITTYKYATVTLKASDGSVQASSTTGGTAFGFDQLTDIQYDANGYIYLTGGVINTGTVYDIKTVKLDTALNIIWSATYASSGAYNDIGTGLAIDQVGNVIVTGYRTSATTGKDYVTIKYSSGGTQRWVATFDGGVNADDSATCIVVSPTDTNKIYVSGFNYNGSSKDYMTLKYDGVGNQKWGIGFNNIYNTDDRAHSIALDSLGNVIVAGQNKLNDTTHTYTTVKYIEKSLLLPDDTTAYTSTAFVYTANRGQLLGTDTSAHPEVRFYTRHSSPNLYFMDTAVSYVFCKLDTSLSNNDSVVRVDMKFKNSNSNLQIRSMDQRSEYSNFFQGHIPEGRSNVPNYDQLVSFNVWNNVDMIYGSNLNGLKYYFICKPGGGGNPAAQIDLEYIGADSVLINGSGELVIYTSLGNIVQPKAAAWQLDANGDYTSLGWQPNYKILGTNEVGFTNFGSFNSSLPLIIAVDWGSPLSLVCPNGVIWSTFMGGASVATGIDQFLGVKTTNAGDVYATGETACLNFPAVTGSAQALFAGGMDAIVTKIYPDGPIDWSCYYGGSLDLAGNPGRDCAFAVDLDNNGNVFIVGQTSSADFPCQPWGGAYLDNSYTASGSSADQFLVKLSADGQSKLWATYYGFSADDNAQDIAISPINGDIYMVGGSGGTFPQLVPSGAHSGTNSGGTIVKFNSSGVRIWSTNLSPATGGGRVEAVCIDGNNDVIVAGYVGGGTSFPIQNAGGNTTYGGGQMDGFVTKFDGATCSIEWSTLMGGDGRDQCHDVIAVQEGATTFYYVVGNSSSSSTTPFPLVQPGFGEHFQGTCAGSNDGTISQFHSSGALFWSTYLGGTGSEEFNAVAADSDDNIYLTGITNSSDFPLPIVTPPNVFTASSILGNADAFIISLRAGIHDYVWGAYYGGSMAEIGWDLSCVTNSRLYLVGYVGTMTDFPLCQGTPTANGTPYYDQSTAVTFKCFVSDLDLAPFINYVGISESEEEAGFSVYPSPASGSITVAATFADNTDVNIEITDLLGRVVYSSTVTNTNSVNKQIDVSNLGDGTYILRLKHGEKMSTRKIQIQK